MGLLGDSCVVLIGSCVVHPPPSGSMQFRCFGTGSGSLRSFADARFCSDLEGFGQIVDQEFAAPRFEFA